jgi:hypothetical protein
VYKAADDKWLDWTSSRNTSNWQLTKSSESPDGDPNPVVQHGDKLAFFVVVNKAVTEVFAGQEIKGGFDIGDKEIEIIISFP